MLLFILCSMLVPHIRRDTEIVVSWTTAETIKLVRENKPRSIMSNYDEDGSH